MHLENKIAIVTGAGKGLGAAIAQALTLKKVIVYGISRNKEHLTQLKNKLGANFHPVVLDVTDEPAITQWVSKTFSSTYLPNILINNAGIGSFSKVDETSTAAWLAIINTNLNGVFYLTSKITALMKLQTQSSHIINIGSIIGKVARSEATAYCASKFAISGFSESLFMELRQYNIKVTCVNLGSIETDLLVNSGVQPHSNMLQPKDIAAMIVHILKTPDNMLIDEITVRPLNSKPPTT